MYSYRKNSTQRPYSRNRRRFKSKEVVDVSRYISKNVETVVETKYTPQYKFEDFNIDSNLKRNILNKKYINPTEIQDKSIPFILEGKDLIGLANTGTGKTIAFLIPLLDKVIKDKNQKVLIITPTRELATQINTELRSLSAGLGIYSTLCIGGVSIGKQIFELKRTVHFLIGTPGRLKDLYQRKVLRLEVFNNIVLDEVDTMLDMGFIDDIKFLSSKINTQRQTLFFSATMNDNARNISQLFLKDPITVSLYTKSVASKNVEQDIVKVKRSENKIDILHNLLIQQDFKKVLIFVKTKHNTENISDTLNKRGFNVQSIHGDKSQAKRNKALSLFRENKINILVATDVASRGLDIMDITHVINYDLPENYEDYIHRIGRTGRAEKKGKALTFIEE